jgi:heptaprenyl diphosphate synthase
LKTRKLVLLALLDAIALTIFMVEAQIPALVPIPGIKLGLSNIVTVFTVFAIGPWEGAAVLFVRIFLGAVFACNFSSILYSGAGGLCAIIATMLLRKILHKKQLWVAGCLGAVAHSVGQMAMAIFVTGTPGIAVYLPVMIACSIVTGLFTGLCAQVLVDRGGKLWKITSK